jgi:hypothetical protein
MKTLMALVLAACGVGSLAGCIDSSDPTPPEPTTNAQAIDVWLAYARDDARVLDSQIEALERARDAGEVTRADVDTAFAAHLACLDEAGVKYIVVEEERVPGSGLSFPGVNLPVSDPGSTSEVDIDDACMFGHDAYIEAAYGNQPRALAMEDAVWTSPSVRSCLASHGFPSDDDASAADIRALDQADWEAHSQDYGFKPCVTGLGG